MSEDRWTLLEGMARTRGYDLAANDDTFELKPQSRRDAIPRSWSLSEEGIEHASGWLLDKPMKNNTWWFR